MKNCLDCGAAVTNHYCSICGQETKLHVPSAREFIHEFVTHYVAIEGKLWKTLRLLILKPGQLTRDFIEGRRQRYVNPLRLFLTFSILFFAVMKLTGTDILTLDSEATRGKVVTSVAQVPGEVGDQVRRDFVRDFNAGNAAAQARNAQENEELELILRREYPAFAARIDAFFKLDAHGKQVAVQQAFYRYAPYAMFLLMPVFALYLKLLYLGTGRYFGEHLLFALHTSAFAYFQLALAILIPYGFISFLLIAWMVAYLPLAMRRVYGGNVVATGARWIVLIFLHLLSIAIACGAAVLLGIAS
jgi:hypothetical protein